MKKLLLLIFTGCFIAGNLHAMGNDFTITVKIVGSSDESSYTVNSKKALEKNTFYSLSRNGFYKTVFKINAISDSTENNIMKVNLEVDYSVCHFPWYKFFLGYTSSSGQVQLTLGDQGCTIPLNANAKLVITAQ